MSNDDRDRNRGASRRDFIKTTTAVGIGLAAPWVISTRKAAAQVVVPTTKDPRFSLPVIDAKKIDKIHRSATRSPAKLGRQ